MIFKNGRFYKHESGTYGSIVGKLNSVVVGKGLVMEMFIPSQKPTLQPVGLTEKATKGWINITRNDFIKGINNLNKDRLEDKLTKVKDDNCMRGIAGRDRNDLHLVLTLECGHTINFSKDDKEPSKGAKFLCKECGEQNEVIKKQLEKALSE